MTLAMTLATKTRTSERLKIENDAEWHAEQSRIAEADRVEREKWELENPGPSAERRDAAMAEHSRLVAAATGAEAEASRAGEALSAAEKVIATITAKITAHDGSSPGIETLASELVVAQARKVALTARLSDHMSVLAAAKAAVTVAERALDDELLLAATATHDGAHEALGERLKAFAREVAREFSELERLREPASNLSEKIQTAAGVPVERQRIVSPGPYHRPDLIAAAFASFLLAAVHEAPVPR
jgi:hypothetical protein